jgi:hypothetical protein
MDIPQVLLRQYFPYQGAANPAVSLIYEGVYSLVRVLALVF